MSCEISVWTASALVSSLEMAQAEAYPIPCERALM